MDVRVPSAPSELKEIDLKYYCVCIGDTKELALLSLRPSSSFHFRGKVSFGPLKGSWLIWGHEFTATKYPPSKSLKEVYSPKGHSLIEIRSGSLDESPQGEEPETRHFLEKYGLWDHEEIRNFVEASSHVGILARLPDSAWVLYLENSLASCKNSPKSIFRDEGENNRSELETLLDIKFFQDGVRLLRESPEWERVHHDFLTRFTVKASKLLAAGGKGVGKSSFLRYVTNRLLKDSYVLYVDLDPGQSEFTPPGFVSVTLVVGPILGPNFCHAGGWPIISYYVGDVNMTKCAKRYMDCVISLLKDLEKLSENLDYPWVINTMGFNRSLGVVLMVDILRLFKPNMVVNIKSRFDRKNYEIDFECHSIGKLERNSWYTKPQHLLYDLRTITAVPESAKAVDMRSNDVWGNPDPRALREITLSAFIGAHFFSAISLKRVRELNIAALKPVKIRWKDVSFQILHVPLSEAVNPFDILNASLVSLGTIEDFKFKSIDADKFRIVPNDLVFQSQGLGIVRAINKAERCVYLITFLEDQELEKINCLSVGAVFPPEACFLTSGLLGKKAPYQSYKGHMSQNSPLDNPWQRNFKPSIRK